MTKGKEDHTLAASIVLLSSLARNNANLLNMHQQRMKDLKFDTDVRAELLFLSNALCGEAGEVAGDMKRLMAFGPGSGSGVGKKPKDLPKVEKIIKDLLVELADVEIYLRVLLTVFKVNPLEFERVIEKKLTEVRKKRGYADLDPDLKQRKKRKGS